MIENVSTLAKIDLTIYDIQCQMDYIDYIEYKLNNHKFENLDELHNYIKEDIKKLYEDLTKVSNSCVDKLSYARKFKSRPKSSLIFEVREIILTKLKFEEIP